MKKFYLTTFFLGLVLQASLLAQDITIEEFIKLNPPVENSGGEPVVGSNASGQAKTVGPPARPGSQGKIQQSAGPRFEQVRLMIPGASSPAEYTLKIQDGLVFLNEDIVLFTEEEYELKKQEKGNFVTFTNLRWPGGRIPYTIPYNHTARTQILAAISLINTNTNLCMVPRTIEPNYVEFTESGTVCWSHVGMQGTGKQEVNVLPGCGPGAILHEILHAAGMWHEHSRNDRDQYITILWDNIISLWVNNFQTEGAKITSLGAYDYGSIMHYDSMAYSKNGLPTIAVKYPPASPGTTIGQRTALSSGDVASIAAMYPSKSCTAPSVTNISLSAPVTVNPNPIQAGQPFIVSTNFLNTGTTSFNGCYYVVIWDRNGERVEAILPSIQENNLPVNTSYSNLQVFSSGGLNVPTGQYIVAVYFRVNCTGEYFFAGNENFPSTFFIQINGSNNLSVSPTSLTFPAAGGTQSISVTSNTTWSISGKPEWLSLSTTSSTGNASVFATAAPNATLSARSATLTFSASGVTSRTVTITQQAATATLSVSPLTLSFADSGGNQAVSVSSNTAWTVSESLSWITLSGTGGTNNGSITVSCEPNPSNSQRSGTIVFAGTGALSQAVTVIQAALSTTLTISPTSLAFQASGSSQNLTITSNTTWTLTESLDWITLSALNGSNNGTIVVTALANSNNSVRTGTITVSGSGISAQTVTVTQSANSLNLTLSTGTLAFSAGGGVNSFDILSNTSWNVSPSASWITVNITSGSNNGTISVTCAPNTSTSSRTANISVWGTGVATQLIIVTQSAQGPTLSVSPTILDYTSQGGNQTINVTSNITWTVSESLSWLSVNPQQGTNNGSFLVVCSPNSGTTARSGTITVSASGVPSQTITVNQLAPTVCLPPGNVVLVQKDYSWFYTSWDQVPGISLYSMRSRAVTDTTWRIDNNLDMLGLVSMAKLPCTEYIIQLRSVCTDTFSSWSPEVRVTLDGCGEAYCYSYGVATGDWIARVAFAGITQVSSVDYGYANRTSVRGTVVAGNTYPLSLIGGFDTKTQGSTYHWKVWIDLNRDNDFSDQGEQVFTQTFSRSASVGGISGNIAIPATATPGITRMRVSMSLSSEDGPCSAGLAFREVEDYSLEIQSGASFVNLSPNPINFTSNGGNQNLTVQSNTTWSVSDTVSWLSMNPASGANNGTVVVSATSNTATVSRNATITVSGAGVATQTVTVSQEGAPVSLSVSPSAFSFNAPGGTATLNIFSNTIWSIIDTLNWIELNTVSGSGNTAVTVTCAPNTLLNSRTASFIVFASGTSLLTVTVTQAGANDSLSVSPTTLSFEAGGGTQNLSVASNTSWTVTDTMSWISVTPASGSNNGSVQVLCSANNSASSRSGNIVFAIAGGNRVVNVTQSGVSEILEVTPVSVDAGPQAGALSVSIVSNTGWSISEAVDWISLGSASGNGNATVAVNFSQNTASSQRTATITLVSSSGLTTRQIAVTQRASGEILPVSWNFKRTENNHTVILPATMVSSVAGQALAPGDYVGIFYTLSGTDICAGNGPWTGSSTSFPVYGDDLTTSSKDGMANSEPFKVKVWRGSNQQTYDVTATYAALGSSGGLINAQGDYKTDGFSMITQLNYSSGPSAETLAIPLKAGWNMVSSYIVPQKPSFDSILKPMTEVVQVVKDGDGKTYLVSLSLNGIGSWEVTQGYRVQAAGDDTLFISGLPVNATTTPIPVREGWQIIPVFSRNAIAPATALATLGTAVDVLKDNEGRVYIPDLSINTIGQLIPTQGYRLKSKSNGELRFPALGVQPKIGEGYSGYRWRETEFFRLPERFNTGANATVVFLASALSGFLAPGDEIGLFTPGGILCGSAKFAGENLAIAIWGASGPKGNFGITVGDRWTVKAWRKSDNTVFDLDPMISSGNHAYSEDQLSIVGAVYAKPFSNSQPEFLRVFPNPGNGYFTLLTNQSLEGSIQIRVYDAAGKIILQQRESQGWAKDVPQRLNISGAPAGTYLVQVISGEMVWTQRINLVK